MRKFNQSVLAVLLPAFVLSACVSDPAQELNAGYRTQAQPTFAIDGKGTNELTFELSEALSGRASSKSRLSEVVEIIRTIDNEGDKVARNSAINELLLASEANCLTYNLSLRSGQVGGRLITDIATAAATATGTVIKPESTVKILSALASFFNASGAAVDRNVYGDQGVEVIFTEIDRMRSTLELSIREKMKSPNYWDYPVSAGIKDVITYHGKCTIAAGLAALPATIATREERVRAVRAATAKALGSNDPNVSRGALLAISGITDEDEINEVLSANRSFVSLTASTVSTETLVGDLDLIRRDAWKCYNAFKAAEAAARQEYVDAAPAGRAAALAKVDDYLSRAANVAECTTAVTPDWQNRYQLMFLTEIASHQAEIDAAYGDVIAGLDSGAPATKDKAIAKLDAAIDAAFAASSRRFIALTDDDMRYFQNARASLLSSAKSAVDLGETPADLITRMTAETPKRGAIPDKTVQDAIVAGSAFIAGGNKTAASTYALVERIILEDVATR